MSDVTTWMHVKGKLVVSSMRRVAYLLRCVCVCVLALQFCLSPAVLGCMYISNMVRCKVLKNWDVDLTMYQGNVICTVVLRISIKYKYINLLKTKRNLLYIRNQSVPRCKHFPPRL